MSISDVLQPCFFVVSVQDFGHFSVRVLFLLEWEREQERARERGKV